MFSEIISVLGSTVVRIADVKSQFPDMVGHVMRKGVRVDRGVYDISEITPANTNPVKVNLSPNTVAQAAVQFAPQPVASSKIDVLYSDTPTVPDVDPQYVPFGCYSIVQKVITSKIFAPVYITGDSGNGKTMGVEQACAKTKRELIIINITNETSEEDLIGGYFLSSGSMVWRDGPVISAMRRGAVLCLDEIDQARPAILAIQTIAQGKPYYIKKTNELVKPAPGFCLIATANTKGDGDGADRFSGAQILNEAFLERFNIVVEQAYPSEAIEKRILSYHSDDAEMIARLTKFANISRRAANDGVLSRCVTTRRLVQICQNISIFGSERKGIELALSRFDSETRDAMIELYEKLLVVDTSVTPQDSVSSTDEVSF